ncbi:MAG: M48 family metallopeptidase [Steroidobacteraceae bacterium]
MDFFRRQAETRRLSRWLVMLFIIAVGACVIAVDFVVVIAATILSQDGQSVAAPVEGLWFQQYPGLVMFSSIVVIGVIFCSSLVKGSRLSAGGSVVAESVGGERVTRDTNDPLRKRLLNVVEEMAIASGVPVPAVYVLEREAGINAFAAGHNPSNAAIAVTRGALTTLNRSELQGVIAHEFSHVLNGDMRLSTRLIGWLFGLMVIALIGRFVLRHAPRGGGGRKGGGAILVIMAAALAVMILGYIGLFFGRLIQAAVSRKRESLADASAVQFTRDPTGLRDALVKIGALGVGSKFQDTDGEEVAHLLFAAGVTRAFATHPPLEERIREIDPGFQPGEFEAMRIRMNRERALATAEEAKPQPAAAGRLEDILQGAIVLAPGAVAQLVANPGTSHVQRAQALRLSLPEEVTTAARDAESARALFLGLALDATTEARARQLAFIEQQMGHDQKLAIEGLLSAIDSLTAMQRMPALLQAFPALHQLGRREREAVLQCLNGLLSREGRVSIYAYALRKLAQVQLRDELQPGARAFDLSIAAVEDDLQTLFSVLAMSGSEDEAEARRAYEIGMAQLLPVRRPPFQRLANWPRRLDLALNRIDRLVPAGKELLVQALVRTISHDLRMTVAESELLRAVCAAVHCPLPPLDAAAQEAS